MANDMINNMGHTVTMVGYLTNTKSVTTSKGEAMQFGSFLDAEGQTFETVSFPQVYRQYYYTGKGIYALKGKIITEYDVCTLELISWERMAISFSKELTSDHDPAAMAEKEGKDPSILPLHETVLMVE
jgi:DNA polymerase-3 subunit alpha